MPKRLFSLFSVSAMFALATVGAGSATAQGTPVVEGDPETAPARPAHIHAGTCDELGDVVIPLNDLIAIDLMASPEAAIASPAADVRTAVPESETTVDASLEEILSGEHAVNVHESAENIQNYIACGEISGDAEAGLVQVSLEELNDSGFAGIATLLANDDGTTDVHVTLVPADSDERTTPAS